MKKNFDEFAVNLSEEFIIELFKDDNLKLVEFSNDGGPKVDVTNLVSKIVSANVAITRDILRQYHEWQSKD